MNLFFFGTIRAILNVQGCKDEWKTETDKKKPLLMKTMEKLDGRIYDVYRDVKNTISKEDHPRMERELMKGSYETNREEVSSKVLEKIKIDHPSLLNIV